MKIVSVVGTRPQLIKAAALLPELRAHHDVVLVDTGQHWDERMAGAFFAELGLPHPDHALGVGGGGHAAQTARMLAALEPVLEAEAPDAVLVYGDTNSTLAGTLAATKLGIPVAHVEAGLRSFDRRMPEEINRVVADHLATWCFAPTKTAVANLAHEGITAGVLARARGETLDLRPAGAARRIVEALGPIRRMGSSRHERDSPAGGELPFEDRLGMLVDREAIDCENRRLERYLCAASTGASARRGRVALRRRPPVGPAHRADGGRQDPALRPTGTALAGFAGGHARIRQRLGKGNLGPDVRLRPGVTP